MPTDLSSQPTTFAGFWRRVGAFMVDLALLGLAGLFLGYFFDNWLMTLGNWGRLLGFCVAWAYFGIMDNKLYAGQTLGKQLLKIKVVDAQGQTLLAPKSFARFVPVGVPWFLNGAYFPDSAMHSAWIYVVSILIFGLGLSLIYLFVFNRPSRQSLHDLMVGSFVVPVSQQGAVSVPPVKRAHLVISSLLVLAAGVAPLLLQGVAQSEPLQSITRLHQAVSKPAWVRRATVFLGKNFSSSTSGGTHNTSFLNITVFVADKNISDPLRARELALLVREADPMSATVDIIQVELACGYDIGIASFMRSQQFSKSPQQWAAQ